MSMFGIFKKKSPLEKLEAEDLPTLVKLDDHGLLIGPNESLDDFEKY